ncbi:AAA domain (Cdc48 subfamily)/AAA domain (dynein-related subfamily), putative [Trypanosoma equiperdum]|uniref:AAA domain (Cdc48 subfamily)/AAA domain (Dynein-related subfamily), putative n=1 Tax=Trypanosoma equiperdum TaxID=5694 RepID=A0A1G4I6S6_TRYEQ|nr:AAA domain (Cdc48 subfamily)/AAA domain (dynein-related subfamily), putative [Trypanosoma equiperdum]
MSWKYSNQEKLFLLRKWPELLEDAINVDGELSLPKDEVGGAGRQADAAKNSFNFSPTFRLPFKAWEAIFTLLDNIAPTDLPSQLCEELHSVYGVNPLIALMVHSCCWFDKGIDDKVFSDQLSSLSGVTKELQLQSQNYSMPSDQKGALDAATVATGILIDVLSLRKRWDEGSEGTERGVEEAINSLIEWSAPKRPVIELARALIVGVVAYAYVKPQFAAAATNLLRKAQTSVNESMVECTRSRSGRSTEAVSPYNITDWRVVKCLETELVLRQKHQDISDFLSATNRWWLTLPETNPFKEKKGSRTVSAEERWHAVRSRYVGQQHVWSSLIEHFLSIGVVEAVKPTVIVLFGPSGYGKSEMARLIACALHKCTPSEAETEGHLVHIHLPSFCTRDSIYSLVDPPAAHIGEGILLSALRRNKEAVVVLDEFEKGSAEAIQNLWLSAFQKHGTLRSLKDAARSISTERVTFVLTCNIAADVIASDEERYLKASNEKERAAMRAEWTKICMDVCRKTMHDPFVNRVDYFFPFVPYTVEEKQQFVKLQLSRIIEDQRVKGVHMYIAPQLVRVLADQLQTFHSSNIEGILRPLLMKIYQKKWKKAVITVEERINCHSYVVIAAADSEGGEIPWTSMPGGASSLEHYDGPERTGNHSAERQQRRTVEQEATNSIESSRRSSKIASNSRGNSRSANHTRTSQVAQSADCAMLLETDVERELRLELEKATELLLEKDKEIECLKHKVLLLERIVAVLLATTLCFMLLLSMIIGTKMVLILAVALTGFMSLLVGMPLKLLIGALRTLYSVLGPMGSAIAFGIMSLWLSNAVRSVATC